MFKGTFAVVPFAAVLLLGASPSYAEITATITDFHPTGTVYGTFNPGDTIGCSAAATCSAAPADHSFSLTVKIWDPYGYLVASNEDRKQCNPSGTTNLSKSTNFTTPEILAPEYYFCEVIVKLIDQEGYPLQLAYDSGFVYCNY